MTRIRQEPIKLKSNTLVVLSLPFQRLIRSHLSPAVLAVLTRRADVAIISPFSENPEFVQRYKGQRISHIMSPVEQNISWLSHKMVVVSTIIRVQGYWFRRKSESPYSWATRHVRFRKNGDDYLAFPKRVISDILAWIGYWPFAWKVFDALHGSWSYKCHELIKMTNYYQQVILIQTSSWGFQDAVLGYLARKYKWRNVLLPYTTDQLFCNGYLYDDYDVVCVQGKSEERWAIDIHQMLPEQVVKLGSLNFFSMREILKIKPVPAKINDKSTVQRVLFAGSSQTYFPAESEFECLEYLLSAIDSGELENMSITYRPIGQNQEIRMLIQQRFAGEKNLNIEFASKSIYGLNSYVNCEWDKIVSDHINNINGFDLMVTAGLTSLSLDVAVLGTASVAFLIDSSGVLEQRKTELMLDHNDRFLWNTAIIAAHNYNDLVSMINRLLENKESRSRIVEKILTDWDSDNHGIMDRLEQAIFM